jgi:PAS domain S-box-containing protein
VDGDAVELHALHDRLDRQARLLEAASATQSAETARLLVETARQLGETLELERVYDRFHTLLAETVPHDGLVVSSYDPEDNAIRAEYVWTDGKRLDPATLPPLELNRSGEGMQSRVITTGKTLLANDVAERVESGSGTYYNVDAERGVRKIPEAGPAATRAAIMVPVKDEGRVVGVVQLMSDRGAYTSEQVELVEALVSQMAAAVRNARLYQALRESEARFRAIFENAAVGISEVDVEGRWLRANDRLCEIVGYSREELLGLTFQQITHPDDLQADLALTERLLAGEIDSFSMEKRYFRKDGGMVWILLAVSLLRDEAGEPLRYIAVVEDIAGRKHAEEERRRLEAAAEAARAVAREREQASRVLAAVGDGIVLVDDSGEVRLWNPAAERILGLRGAHVLGRRLEDLVPAWREVRERLPRGDETSAETLPLEVGDEELWLSLVAVRSADGVIYAFRDETHERTLEQAKSEFIATVSHELRTPLAAVYGAAQTLLRQDFVLTDDQRRPLLEMVAIQCERLTDILEEVLLASKLERGELPLDSEPLDVGEIAREIVAAMRARLPEGTTLELSASPELPPARGDTAKFRQVLVNLVDNAIKYSPDGGTVTVAVEARDGSVRVEVSDRGLGIPTSEQERVFEKFYRVDPHLSRGPGGTGLGLYICRELVQRMDGRIDVESTEGMGSTFSVELPLATA